MSVVIRKWVPAHRLFPDEIAAIAEYMHIDWEQAAELANDLLGRRDGLDLVGWLLQDHADKARWRCDEKEAARRQELYQRFLDRSLHGGCGRI